MTEIDKLPLTNLIRSLSNAVGSTEPALRLLLSVLAGYPLSIIHRKFIYGREPNYQHLMCLSMGLSIGYFNYGCDILHSVVTVVVTYLTLLLLGGNSISLAVVFIFNMGYLLTGYYYVGTDSYDINWTMPQCVLVLRLIGLAFDYADGQRPFEKLSTDSKKVALKTLPSFLEVCGHSFFPASFMIGPQFPMKRYQDFVAGKYSDDPKVAPNSEAAALQRCLLGVFYLAVFQFLGGYISDDYILSDDYKNLGFIKKCFYLGLWGRYTLYKYISCWLLTEGACILFGITYNGKDENGYSQWNGCENVKISILENASEFNDYILSFNTNTNSWVAQYIYKRLKFFGNRYISQGVALLFLAIWHGFHSGYYICFAFEFMVMYLEKDVKPLALKNPALMNFLSQPPVNIIFKILLRIYTFVFMGWSLLPFALLTFHRYWQVYESVHYIGFIFFSLYPILYKPIVGKLLKVNKPLHVE